MFNIIVLHLLEPNLINVSSVKDVEHVRHLNLNRKYNNLIDILLSKLKKMSEETYKLNFFQRFSVPLLFVLYVNDPFGAE